MPRTIEEVRAELNTVNSAIQSLIAGNRLTQLRVGSGDFARLYVNQEISLESLRQIRAELLQELSELENTDGIKFRKDSNIVMVTGKFRR